jgi:hypothetical protein
MWLDHNMMGLRILQSVRLSLGSKAFVAHLYAFVLFGAFAIVLTTPLICHLSARILGDPGDPLLNTWILGWNIDHFIDGELTGLFHGNIFYPHTNTLAYSEHLLGPSLVGTPLMAFTGNPILTYNVLFLSGLAFSAFAMYLLAFHLVGDRIPAFVAGLVFGFFPFHFAHIGHIQLQMAFGLPLSLLFLHRYFESRKGHFLALFGSLVILQFLSCGYYGMFLLVCVVVVTAGEICFRRIRLSQVAVDALVLAFAGCLLLPLFLPYLTVKKEMGFVRTLSENISFSATLTSYLAAPSKNVVWGLITQRFVRPEAELFFGAVPLSLAFIGLLGGTGLFSLFGTWRPLSVFRKTMLWGVGAASLIYLMASVTLFLTAVGTHFSLFGHDVRLATLHKPLALFILGGVVWLLLHAARDVESDRKFPAWPSYAALLALGFFLSLGPEMKIPMTSMYIPGPYRLLHAYVPGFDGLRVPARAVIISALSLSIFAAIGARHVLSRMTITRRNILSLALLACITLEFLHVPVQTTAIEVGEKVPEVYKWLQDQERNAVVLELPMPENNASLWKEARYMYFSLYHKKKLINGYSGYFPPDYMKLMSAMSEFPSSRSITLLGNSGADYVIVHGEVLEPGKRKAVLSQFEGFSDKFVFVRDFGTDTVYQIRGPRPTVQAVRDPICKQGGP